MQIHLVWREIGRKIKWFEKQTTEHIKSKSITLIEREDMTLLEEMPGSMLGSHACRAAGYCTESCLQNIFAILCFAVHGKKTQKVLFLHEAVMSLAYAWHQTGCSLRGFPSCIFADSRPAFQRGSQPAFQALGCQTASLASHRSGNQNDWTGTNLLWTSHTNWLIPLSADMPVTEAESWMQYFWHSQMWILVPVCTEMAGAKKGLLQTSEGKCWLHLIVEQIFWLLCALLPVSSKKSKSLADWSQMGLCGEQHNTPICVTPHGQTSCSLGSREQQH